MPLRTWWVRFTGTDSNGRRRQLRQSLGTEDRDEAVRRASELLLRHSKTPIGPSGPIELSTFLSEYRQHLFATKTRITARNEFNVLRAFFETTFPHYPNGGHSLKEVSTHVISAYIDRRRIQDRISEKTAYHIRQALHTLFNYAIRVKGFSQNPAANVTKPKVRLSGEITYLRKPQITELLKTVREEDSLLHGPVATAILAGLRRSEIVWLTWKDVDLERSRLQIRFKTVHGERYSPKTNKSRIVPIAKALGDLLENLPRRSETWLFPSPKGLRWHPDNMTRRLQILSERHGWKDHTFLVFRHTFGSQLAQKGLSLYKISKLMGNSEKICREHYAALAVEDMHPDVEFMGEPGGRSKKIRKRRKPSSHRRAQEQSEDGTISRNGCGTPAKSAARNSSRPSPADSIHP